MISIPTVLRPEPAHLHETRSRRSAAVRRQPLDLDHLEDPHGWLADGAALLEHIEHWQSAFAPELERRWLYFTDEPLMNGRVTVRGGENGRPMITGQEIGLPYRISGLASLGSWWGVHPQVDPGSQLDLERKEVVTENEIGWRVRTFIDWCLGDAGPVLQSEADDPGERAAIEELLAVVFDAQHRGSWLREWCLQSAVYGFADVLVRLDDSVTLELRESDNLLIAARTAEGQLLREGDFERFAGSLRWVICDPRQVVPLRDPRDPDRLWGWIRAYRTAARPAHRDPQANEVHWIELHTPARSRVFRRYDNEQTWVIAWDAANRLQALPVVHKTHERARGRYDGCGIVEPLIPLQNELNIRLSDRAHKITMQAFRMYLGKGLENFADRVIGPGRMWHTDNLEASIEEFGGATSDEGENLHIQEVREAMDRVSAIPALAAGDIRGRIGNLTSATALETVLRGLMAKVRAQREVDGRALASIAERTLDHADALGVLRTRPKDRRVRVEWPVLAIGPNLPSAGRNAHEDETGPR